MEVECKHHITVWISVYLSASTHPSTTPALTYFLYRFLHHCVYYKSHLLKKITRPLSVTFLLRRTLYLLLMWNSCCISIRFIPPLNLFLCAHSLCRSASFALYETIRLYINMQTFTPHSIICI